MLIVGRQQCHLTMYHHFEVYPRPQTSLLADHIFKAYPHPQTSLLAAPYLLAHPLGCLIPESMQWFLIGIKIQIENEQPSVSQSASQPASQAEFRCKFSVPVARQSSVGLNAKKKFKKTFKIYLHFISILCKIMQKDALMINIWCFLFLIDLQIFVQIWYVLSQLIKRKNHIHNMFSNPTTRISNSSLAATAAST